jgi:hypothetical protein
MINKSFSKKLTAYTAGVLMCCSVLFIQSNARAQSCLPGWTFCTAPQVVTIPGTSCLEDVYYCWQVSGGIMYFQIDFVEPDEWSNCETLPPAELINSAISGFEANPPNPSNVSIPACGQGEATTFEYTVSDCWGYIPNPFILIYCAPTNYFPPCYIFAACQGGSSACQTVCTYCQSGVSNGNPVISEISCTKTNTYNGDCNTDAPTSVTGWVFGTCYNIHPCN